MSDAASRALADTDRPLPAFLSVVIVLRNQAERLVLQLERLSALLPRVAVDYEIIVVDNGSTDDTLPRLHGLTSDDGLPNLQVYALTTEVDFDTAAWAGVESALGDYVAVLDPHTDELDVLPLMLDRAAEGADVIFAANRRRLPHGLLYRAGAALFNQLYVWFNGVKLSDEAPRYRLLSKRVVNYVLRHPQPAIAYRHLPLSGGFARARLEYDAPLAAFEGRRLGESVDRAMKLLVSTTRAPMRLVTTLSLFGAVSNVLYSFYVIGVGILRTDVAPGWVTLSLQQSGMFFLISLVLLVLGEYILHMASLTNEGPGYYVGQEFTSARMVSRERLNVDDAAAVPRVRTR